MYCLFSILIMPCNQFNIQYSILKKIEYKALILVFVSTLPYSVYAEKIENIYCLQRSFIKPPSN